MAFRPEDLILPGILVGGLVVVVVFKDEVVKLIGSLGDLLPSPSPEPEPEPTDGNGNGDGDGNGEPKPTPKPTPCVKKTCSSGQIWSQSQCKCVSRTAPPPPSGTTWHRANGASVTLGKGRQDGESNRWNKNVTGWTNGFEVRGYLTVTGMQGGSHIGLKMAGPNHSGGCGYKQGGSCCCWWDGGLRRNGDAYLEIEYPHPSNKNEKILNKMGRNIDAGVLGVRWLNAKEGSGRRVMFWIDKSGKVDNNKWTLMYSVLDKGEFMPTSYYSKIPNEIELEIRISDVSPGNIKWHTGPTGRKIEGSPTFYTHVLDHDDYDSYSFRPRVTIA